MNRIKKNIAITFVFVLIFTNISFAESKIKWDEEIIYFILTDRFFDGDKSNNELYGKDSYDLNHLEAYHGGDFQGIIDKVSYLRELGITTLWITPVVKNIETNMRKDINDKQYGYHGYWAEDFTKIDPHLGNEEKLMELVDVLADNGIKLMVDVVLNHAGYGMNNEKQFNDMFRKNPDKSEVKGELAGLPDFKTEEREVRDKLIKWQSYWANKISPKGNKIAYFRVDTVKHVDKDTWKDFKSKIIELNPNFKMIGEVFDANITKTGGYLDDSMMDSLLDFDFKNVAYSFSKGNFEDVNRKLKFRNSKINENITMGQFLSSHDENGFLKMKLNNDVNLFKPVVSLQLTTKGQPVIYYGEEIGMSGKKDDFTNGVYSENRESFKWDKVKDNKLTDHYKKMIEIRKMQKDVFSKGGREMVYSDKNVYVFERKFGDKSIITFLNKSNENQNIEIDNKFNSMNLVNLYSREEIKAGKTIKVNVPKNEAGGTVVLIDKNYVPKDFKVKKHYSSIIYIFFVFNILLISFIIFLIIKKKNKN
ncbi:alpha-amylase family glycosyl hydrolase [Helcococcus ovis]|uniref:alpha-amylase family glycosyl hydrolase n=1 Tax=Helcococcus TaxID=31983 RepID=UPI0038BB8B9D